MIIAFRRLALISIITLSIIALGVGVLRGLGLLQVFSRLSHPLIEQKVHISFQTQTLPQNPHHIPGLHVVWDQSWKIKSSQKDLKEHLKTYTHSAIFLEIEHPDAYHLKSLYPLLAKFEDRVIVSTPHPTVFQTARKDKPEWLFAANQIKWTQLRIMASLFLETVAVTKEDIFIITAADLRNQSNLQRVLDELRRRKKILLFRSTSPLSSPPQWVDGTISL